MLNKTCIELHKSNFFWLLEHLFFITFFLIFHQLYPSTLLAQYILVFLGLFYMIFITFLLDAKPSDFGLTTKNFKKAFLFNFFSTIAIAIVMQGAKMLFPHQFALQMIPGAMLYYIVISVPLQEIIFRGFCLWRTQAMFNNKVVVIMLSSLYFTAYHLIFQNWWFVVSVFFINMFWSYYYLRYPNIYPFILSHALLGYLHCF
jgi:membrane protease YdiL (CAAX protease family)